MIPRRRRTNRAPRKFRRRARSWYRLTNTVHRARRTDDIGVRDRAGTGVQQTHCSSLASRCSNRYSPRPGAGASGVDRSAVVSATILNPEIARQRPSVTPSVRPRRSVVRASDRVASRYLHNPVLAGWPRAVPRVPHRYARGLPGPVRAPARNQRRLDSRTAGHRVRRAPQPDRRVAGASAPRQSAAPALVAPPTGSFHPVQPQ